MRLDKYLKVSRLIKRRTVANEACDNARISVNGKPAKASYDVKVGDQIEIAFGSRTLKVEVLAVAEAVRKDDASAMYKEIPAHIALSPAVYCTIRQAKEGALWKRKTRCKRRTSCNWTAVRGFI